MKNRIKQSPSKSSNQHKSSQNYFFNAQYSGVVQKVEASFFNAQPVQAFFNPSNKPISSTTIQKQGEIANNDGPNAADKPVNKTGLPDSLKSGVENLSGYSMDDVKVHYNSNKPKQLNALAFAQGSNIHVAPGQEQHLPHEAWHVVQQKQGRVKPTLQMKGGVAINDDAGFEREADTMGGKALSNHELMPKDVLNAKLNASQLINPIVQAIRATGALAWSDCNVGRDQNKPGNWEDFKVEGKDQVRVHFHANNKEAKSEDFESFTATFEATDPRFPKSPMKYHYTIDENGIGKWDGKSIPPKAWQVAAENSAKERLQKLTGEK